MNTTLALWHSNSKLCLILETTINPSAIDPSGVALLSAQELSKQNLEMQKMIQLQQAQNKLLQ